MDVVFHFYLLEKTNKHFAIRILNEYRPIEGMKFIFWKLYSVIGLGTYNRVQNLSPEEIEWRSLGTARFFLQKCMNLAKANFLLGVFSFFVFFLRRMLQSFSYHLKTFFLTHCTDAINTAASQQTNGSL
jgi:hypothetical protein